MGFQDKKGITVASGFKLQATVLLDARGQVKNNYREGRAGNAQCCNSRFNGVC